MMVVVPVETHMKLSETKQHLSKLVNEVAQGKIRVVVEKSGLPAAAIISTEEYARFLRAEEERAQRFAVLHRISDALADIPVEKIEAEVQCAIEQSRAKRRAQQIASA